VCHRHVDPTPFAVRLATRPLALARPTTLDDRRLAGRNVPTTTSARTICPASRSAAWIRVPVRVAATPSARWCSTMLCAPAPMDTRETVPDERLTPCQPSPCGPNAECRERNGAGSCTCLPEYFGDPYSGCRPECVVNSDCSRDRSCVNQKCVDPCPGVCGLNAQCRVSNHLPSCTCLAGYTGNPSSACREIPQLPPPRRFTTSPPHGNTNQLIPPTIFPAERDENPCRPSPCGPYSQCREVNGHAVCSCLQGYIGSAPSCRPECIISSDCAQDLNCQNQKCVDPCPGTCGIEARCQVINHYPACSCAPGFTGDPFNRCTKILCKHD